MQESISATKSEEIVNDFDVKISSEVLFVDGTEREICCDYGFGK